MSYKVAERLWGVKLPQNEMLVLQVMAGYANEEGRDVFPSVGRLAWATGYSKRQVERIIGKLLQKGILILEAEAWGEYGTNKYRINWAACDFKKPYEPKRPGRPPKPRGAMQRQGETTDVAMSGDMLQEQERGDVVMSGGFPPETPDAKRHPPDTTVQPPDTRGKSSDTAMSANPSIESVNKTAKEPPAAAAGSLYDYSSYHECPGDCRTMVPPGVEMCNDCRRRGLRVSRSPRAARWG